MLYISKYLQGCSINAADGEIGKVKDVLFDDRSWRVRYVVVDTGGWLSSRKVLISPTSLVFNVGTYELSSPLTRDQIEASPPIEQDLPVSRQHEEQLSRHYGWPTYWTMGGMPAIGMIDVLGRGYAPMTVGRPTEELGADDPQMSQDLDRSQNWDPHLRSSSEIDGYRVEAVDGEIGHVSDMVLEQDDWSIRYLLADTRNWLPGKKVVLDIAFVDDISWFDKHVRVHMTRDAVKAAPEYDTEVGIKPAYEAKVRAYYGELDGKWRESQGRGVEPSGFSERDLSSLT